MAQEQIDRIQKLRAKNVTDAFSYLELDVATCEFSDFAKRYRRLVLLIHPDKCKLPHAEDCFKAVEEAYRKIPSEAVLSRLKTAHQRKLEREAKLKEDQAARGNSSSAYPHNRQPVDGSLTKEQRIERMRQAAREEHYLEAARLAEEAAFKMARHEKKVAEDAAINAALERQIAEERELHLF